MVKEFFKSIFRTWGRLFAYILLGILAYFIFSWFGLPEVKAQTIETNNFRIWAFGSGGLNDGVLYQDNSSAMAYSPSYGWQIYPYNNGLVGISKSSYSITINYVVHYNALWVASGWRDGWFGWNTYLQVVKGNNYINATCDGIESNTATRYTATDPDNLGRKTWTAYFTYSCDLFNVTDNFDFFSFKIYNNSDFARSIGGTQEFRVESFQFLDKEDVNDNSQAIINNQNNNTNRIIDNNNSNTTIINNSINETNSNLEDINDTMLDDSDADLGFMEEIADWMPIDTPVTDIILLPISILNKTINALGGTCSPYTINSGSLLGNHNITFPCINPGNYLSGYSYKGFTLWELIDLMFCMYMGYEILMLIISAYNGFANLEDSFDTLYTPRHSGYAMKHGEGRL